MTEISDTLFPKSSPESRIETPEDGIEIVPEVIGLAYDEVIETDIEGRVTFENGKVIPYSGSAEELADIEASAPKPVDSEYRRAEIVSELGRLKERLDGLALLEEPTEETEARIESLKKEYASLN
ncbi:MAG: hypothetical protein WA194_07150 [Patescibacteria group bacterium]